VIRENQVVTGDVERLAFAVQLIGEFGTEKLRAGASGAVKDEHRVAHDAAVVAARRAERAIMQAQFGQGLTGIKMKIVDDKIALERRRKIGRVGRAGIISGECKQKCE